MTSPPDTAGGFITNGVLSPPSSVASTVRPALPTPRAHPLKYGSNKESTFIRYMDGQISDIQRRFAKRKVEADSAKSEEGYQSFQEVGPAIESLVDVVWISGTPSLQIPYLLSIALLANDTVRGFPPAPKTTFRLLHKLDYAFSCLLQGCDIDTGETLPGFETGRKVTDTEKVRIKGIIERTRVAVVEVMSSGEYEEEADEDEQEESAAEDDEMDVDGSAEESWEMEMVRVYDKTIVELGDTIGGEPIGIVTDQ